MVNRGVGHLTRSEGSSQFFTSLGKVTENLQKASCKILAKYLESSIQSITFINRTMILTLYLLNLDKRPILGLRPQCSLASIAVAIHNR